MADATPTTSAKKRPAVSFWGLPHSISAWALRKKGGFIDYGAWQNQMEKDDPIENERRRLFPRMFKDPRWNFQMTAYAFDKIATEALQDAHKLRSTPLSMVEVRRLYGIYLWRVGGDSSHKKSGTPKDYRKSRSERTQKITERTNQREGCRR